MKTIIHNFRLVKPSWSYINLVLLFILCAPYNSKGQEATYDSLTSYLKGSHNTEFHVDRLNKMVNDLASDNGTAEDLIYETEQILEIAISIDIS